MDNPIREKMRRICSSLIKWEKYTRDATTATSSMIGQTSQLKHQAKEARNQEHLLRSMAAKAKHHLAFLLLGAAVAAVSSSAAAEANAAAAGNGTAAAAPTAYEMLERYHFPRGILPEGVKGYVLRPDGSFEVYFPMECEFLLAGQWLVRYDSRVAGAAADGALRALRGVSVRVLFLWVAVGEVDRAGEQLSFRVGPVSKSFPLRVFAESPRCRGYGAGHAGAAAAS